MRSEDVVLDGSVVSIGELQDARLILSLCSCVFRVSKLSFASSSSLGLSQQPATKGHVRVKIHELKQYLPRLQSTISETQHPTLL